LERKLLEPDFALQRILKLMHDVMYILDSEYIETDKYTCVSSSLWTCNPLDPNFDGKMSSPHFDAKIVNIYKIYSYG